MREEKIVKKIGSTNYTMIITFRPTRGEGENFDAKEEERAFGSRHIRKVIKREKKMRAELLLKRYTDCNKGNIRASL